MKEKSIPVYLLIAGCIGLMLWSAFSRRSEEVPTLIQQRFNAISSARQALKVYGWETGPNLHITADVLRNSPDSTLTQMRYIWKTHGKLGFHALLGSYLFPTGWKVKIEDGELSHNIFLDNNGKAFRIQTVLPESFKTGALTVQAADTLALDFAATALLIPSEHLVRILQQTSTVANRMQRTYVYEDMSVSPVAGERFIAEVQLTGDKVTDFRRYIRFPSGWAKHYQMEREILSFVKTLTSLLIGLILALGAYLGIRKWKKGAFHKPTYTYNFAFIVISCIIIRLFSIPSDLSNMAINRSLLVQWLPSAGFFFFWIVLYGLAVGVAAGFIKEWKVSQLHSDRQETVWGAIGIGGILLGFVAAAQVLMPTQNLHLPDVRNASALYPAIVQALKTGILFVTINTVVSIVMYCFEMITSDWKRYHLAGILWLAAFGVMVSAYFGLNGITPPDFLWSIVYALFTMIVLLTAYLTVFRYDFRMLSVTLFLVMTGDAVNLSVIHPYPNSLKGAILGIMLMFGNMMITLYYNQAGHIPADSGIDKNA